MKRFHFFLIALLLGASCASQPGESSEAQEAQATLVNFLTSLNTGQYIEAASIYDGEYEQLQIFNPEIEPSDHTALWSWACENQLLQCLEIRNVVYKETTGNIYTFQVEFSNKDGSLFVLGPCCGSDESEMPPVSQFEYRVKKTAADDYFVMDMPPYVP